MSRIEKIIAKLMLLILGLSLIFPGMVFAAEGEETIVYQEDFGNIDQKTRHTLETIELQGYTAPAAALEKAAGIELMRLLLKFHRFAKIWDIPRGSLQSVRWLEHKRLQMLLQEKDTKLYLTKLRRMY